MSVPTMLATSLAPLATNATSPPGSSGDFTMWLAIGALGVLIVGFLVWYFFLRNTGD